VHDGDRVAIDSGLALRAPDTLGHTPHHTSCALEDNGPAVAVFTGGSLLIGTLGRPDLVEPRPTEGLACVQHASVHRLAAELPGEADRGRGAACHLSGLVDPVG
jgi:hydroxyacylglutathione hydrolase